MQTEEAKSEIRAVGEDLNKIIQNNFETQSCVADKLGQVALIDGGITVR